MEVRSSLRDMEGWPLLLVWSTGSAQEDRAVNLDLKL